MKIENQVTSLDLSKKLKSLNVKQESLFYWEEFENEVLKPEISYHTVIKKNKYIKLYSAFTSSELLEMLPKIIYKTDKNDELYVKIYKGSYGSHDNLYVLELNEEGGYDADYTVFNSEDKNISNALAKMLIYIIENKYMDIKQ